MIAGRRGIAACAWLLAAHGATAAGAGAPGPNDGSHDFDFEFGTWKTHSSRMLRPLSGRQEWVEMEGVTVVRPIWAGRGNIAEYRADGPGSHVELLALRLYDPRSKQWNIHFATSARGTFAVPAWGSFRQGRIDFFDQEASSGRSVLVRFSLWPVDHDNARSEQAFSVDGGRTWEVNWKTEYQRIAGAAEAVHAIAPHTPAAGAL